MQNCADLGSREFLTSGFLAYNRIGLWDYNTIEGGHSMQTRLRVIAGAVLLAVASTLAAQTGPLKVGDKAPDFTLPDQNGNKVSLSQFLGKKNVVLAFYVLAFTGG